MLQVARGFVIELRTVEYPDVGYDVQVVDVIARERDGQPALVVTPWDDDQGSAKAGPLTTISWPYIRSIHIY